MNKKNALLIIPTIIIIFLAIFAVYKFFTAPMRLKTASANSGYLYAASSDKLSVNIANKQNNYPTVEIKDKHSNGKISFTLANLDQQTVSQPIKSNNKLTYQNILPNTDLTYQTIENGIKEEIILKTPTGQNQFIFNVNIEGNMQTKSITKDFGANVFYDNKGNYLFHIEPPFAIDAAGNRTDNVSFQIYKDQATLTVDPNWLNSPDRVYPITIDPTVVHDTTSEFATGQLDRLHDTGSGSSPTPETYYQELGSDIHTIGLWHMNEASGTNVADSSGNSNTGTATGASIVSGLFGNARSFTGTNDISVTDSASLDLTTAYTLEAWIYPTTLNDWHAIVVKGNFWSSYGMMLNGTGSANKLRCYTNNTSDLDSNYVFATNSWYHVACVWDGNNKYVYVNGVLDNTGSWSGTLTNNASALTIGRDVAGDYYTFQGSIDEVRVSNTARSPEEIKLNALRRPSSVYTSPVLDLTDVSAWNSLSWTELGVATGDGETVYDSTSLFAQWNFNETSGTTADNAAGSCGASCDGTLSGFDSTASQDADPDSSWTANNRRWGAGALTFDNTDSYISIGDIAAIDSATELSSCAWVNHKTTSDDDTIIQKAYIDNPYYDGFIFMRDDVGQTSTRTDIYKIIVWDDDDVPNLAAEIEGASGAAMAGTWNHVCFTYKANDATGLHLYINGAEDPNSPVSTVGIDSINSGATSMEIGRWAANGKDYSGTMDTLSLYTRVLPASEILSLYNSNNVEFQTRVGTDSTPNDGSWEAWKPITAETAIASMDSDSANWTQDYFLLPYTNTLLHMDGADTSTTFTDVLGKTWTARADAQVDTAQCVFGGASVLMDGTGDWIDTPDTDDVNFGTGNFTIDFWVRMPNTTTASHGFTNQTTDGNTQWCFGTVTTSMQFFVRSGGATIAQYSFTHGMSANTWYHIALVRSGSTIYIFKNGVSQTLTVTTAIGTASMPNATQVYYVGTAYLNSAWRYLNGWIDEFRVSKGIARWTSDFTPPTSAYNYLNTDSTTPATLSDESTIKIEGSGSLKTNFGDPKVDTNTVGLWHLDETSGTSAYIKDSASTNHGTPTGTTVVDGFSSKARSFNGTSDVVTISSVMGLGTTNLTMSAWVNLDSASEHGAIIKIGTGSNGFGIGVGATTFEDSGNNLIFLYETVRWGDTNVNIGTGWHHVALVINASGKPNLFIDGASVFTDTGTNGTTPTTTSYIGGYTTNRYLDAVIDEVRISNVTRSAEEIAEEYRAGRDHYLNKTISSTDLSAKTSLPFYVASDRLGTFLNATIGESAFANYQTDANTVGLWHLEEESGSGAYIKDSTTNANHGTLGVGTSSPDFTQGKIGKARTFNGSSDFIDLGTAANLSFTTQPFTIEAWVYPTTSQLNAIFGTDNNSDGYGLRLLSTTNLLSFKTRGTTDNQTDSVTAIPLNQWSHVTATFSGTNGAISLYINGVLDKYVTYTGSITSSTNGADIGRRTHGDAYFAGNIDEVRISDVVRTADEIRQAYEIGLRTHPITIDFKAKLVASYLIADVNDLSFTIDETAYGSSAAANHLFLGDKIIVKENYDGTEYVAQGTVNAVNSSTGVTTVTAWDTGSTFPSGGYTVNATVFKWQREYFNITDGLSAFRNAITSLTLRYTDGSQGATVWLDDFKSSGGYLTTPGGSTITSSTGNRYFQYRAISSSYDKAVSTIISAVTLDYTTNPNAPSVCVVEEAADDSSLTVKWQDNSSDEDGFEIEREVAGGGWTDLTTKAANSTSHLDDTISQGNVYQYRVASYYTGPLLSPWTYCPILSIQSGSFQFEGLKLEGLLLN